MSSTANTPATDLERLADEYFAAWAACDPDLIIGFHTDDTRFQIHVGGEPALGRDAVRKAFADIFEQWPGFDFESHRVLFGDDHWVLDWTLKAQLASDDGSSRPVTLDCLDVVVISDGLVARKDTYVDAGQLQVIIAG
jgi:uncharacterized protein (TIGR02246 family)